MKGLIQRLKPKMEVMDLRDYCIAQTWETCHIPYNKIAMTITIVAVVACLVTPFTNWLIIPIIKIARRHI